MLKRISFFFFSSRNKRPTLKYALRRENVDSKMPPYTIAFPLFYGLPHRKTQICSFYQFFLFCSTQHTSTILLGPHNQFENSKFLLICLKSFIFTAAHVNSTTHYCYVIFCCMWQGARTSERCAQREQWFLFPCVLYSVIPHGERENAVIIHGILFFRIRER